MVQVLDQKLRKQCSVRVTGTRYAVYRLLLGGQVLGLGVLGSRFEVQVLGIRIESFGHMFQVWGSGQGFRAARQTKP